MAAARDARSTGAGGPRPNYPIGSVDSVLRLLLMLSRQKQVRVSDASAELGTAVSTAHRLLQMLVHYGFAVQNPDSQAYQQGPALLEVGLSAVKNLDVRTVLRPFVERLRDEVGETTHLAVVRRDETFFIDCAESPVALRVASRVGTSMWAHCTSAGKAWLACKSDEDLQALYPTATLPGITDHSLRSRAALFAELEDVRRNGFARSHNESELGVGSVSAAVRDPSGRPVASLTVSVPLVRMPDERWPRLAESVQRTRAAAEEAFA